MAVRGDRGIRQPDPRERPPVTIRTPRDAIRHGMGLVPDDRKAKGLVLGASSAREHRAARPPRPLVPPQRRANARAADQLMGELRIRAVSLDQPLRYLSGGNQQKAVLAKWLSAGANMFLLDEPTRGVDVRSKAEIYDIIRALCAARLRRPAGILRTGRTAGALRTASWSCIAASIAGELSRAEATEERIMQLATGGAH